MAKNEEFCSKSCVYQKKVVLLRRKTQNKTTMIATPMRKTDVMPVSYNPSAANKQFRTVENFMDDLAKRLGRHYGLNDIREAL